MALRHIDSLLHPQNSVVDFGLPELTALEEIEVVDYEVVDYDGRGKQRFTDAE